MVRRTRLSKEPQQWLRQRISRISSLETLRTSRDEALHHQQTVNGSGVMNFPQNESYCKSYGWPHNRKPQFSKRQRFRSMSWYIGRGRGQAMGERVSSELIPIRKSGPASSACVGIKSRLSPSGFSRLIFFEHNLICHR